MQRWPFKEQLGLQWYTSVLVHRDIFCHDTNIVYWTSYRDIYDTFTYASTNMGKHCLQLVLTLLLLHGDFPNKLMRKIHAEQCLALYSRQGLSAVQTSEPTSKTLLVLLLCIVTTVSGYYRIVEKCIVAGLVFTYLPIPYAKDLWASCYYFFASCVTVECWTWHMNFW